MKKVWNVFGILFASVFSMILVVALVGTCVVWAVSSFTQSDTIQQVVASVDYTELIKKDEGMTKALEEYGINGDVIQEVMETEAVGEILDLYVEDVFSAVEGNDKEAALTAEALEDILKSHKEELFPAVTEFVQAQMGEELTMSEEEMEQVLDTLVEEQGENIITMLPSAKEMGIALSEPSEMQIEQGVSQENSEILQLIAKIHNGQVVFLCIFAAVVISVLILLCRWVHFEGFMWLGVTYLISMILSLVLTLIVKDVSRLQLFGVSMEEMGILDMILPVFGEKLTKGTVTLAVLSVIFIVIFVMGRVVLKRKRVEQ